MGLKSLGETSYNQEQALIAASVCPEEVCLVEYIQLFEKRNIQVLEKQLAAAEAATKRLREIETLFRTSCTRSTSLVR